MSAKILLRIASILMLLHTIGHTIGSLTWTTAPNQQVAQTIASMQNNHFDFGGRSVTLASFFNGYGFIMIFVMLLVVIFLWMLSGNRDNPLARRLLSSIFFFLAIFAVLEFIYFFPFAALFTALSAICVLATLLRKSS